MIKYYLLLIPQLIKKFFWLLLLSATIIFLFVMGWNNIPKKVKTEVISSFKVNDVEYLVTFKKEGNKVYFNTHNKIDFTINDDNTIDLDDNTIKIIYYIFGAVGFATLLILLMILYTDGDINYYIDVAKEIAICKLIRTDLYKDEYYYRIGNRLILKHNSLLGPSQVIRKANFHMRCIKAYPIYMTPKEMRIIKLKELMG